MTVSHLSQLRQRREEIAKLKLMIKLQLGYAKVHYRWLAKNTAQLHTLVALSNLWMVR